MEGDNRMNTEENAVIERVKDAADNIEMALSHAHLYKYSKELEGAVWRLGQDVLQLLKVFPDIRAELLSKEIEGVFKRRW
jgi:hypothetical protein